MTSKGEILIVEDNHASLRLLAEILTDEGYLVRPADGGAIALASINAKLPDLILLDIQMEGVNGFEVLKNVKESPKSQDVPVIFLSATTNLEERVEGLRLGAVDFISKPYKKEELLARVAIQMQMRRLYAEIQQQKDQLAQTVEQLKAEIEERQRAEAALQRLNADLEQRVAQRTAHLEAANRELTAFTYSISHDLRVPLRAIAGFSHILNDEYHNILDGEGQRLLGVIRQNTVKLESLIDDILVLLAHQSEQAAPLHGGYVPDGGHHLPANSHTGGARQNQLRPAAADAGLCRHAVDQDGLGATDFQRHQIQLTQGASQD